MKLSVVIVSYNVKYYLEQCLLSLRRALNGIDAEIRVIDNASSDNTPAYIARRFPEARIIANNSNLGFARANNIAIKQARGEYILLLNPDTIVAEDTLARCLRFMDNRPDAGACGVAMLKDDGSFAYESRRGLPTPFTAFCKISGLCALFPRSRLFGRYYLRYLNKNKINRIDVVSGAFCFLRRSAIDKVGLLDEDFFMYGEDIDLSFRLLKAGYKNFYLPLRILHYKGESTQKSSARYVHVFYNAMLIFFNKHYRNRFPLLAPIVRTAVTARALLDFCTQKNKRLKRKNKRKKNWLFIGQRETFILARQLLADNAPDLDFAEASEKNLPHGHLQLTRNLNRYDCVVYDTDAFSYKRILLIMAHQLGKNHLRLGTCSPLSRRLVTMDCVY